MKPQLRWAGLALHVAALCASAPRARAEAAPDAHVAAAPAAPGRPGPDPDSEPAEPVTAVGPGPAFEPESTAPDAAETAPVQPQRQRFQRWTPEEIARVRAALARQRQQMLSEAKHTPGDARAHFTLGLDVSAISRPDVGFERFDLGRWSPRFGLFVAYDLLPIHEQVTLLVELGAALERDEADNLLGVGTSAALSSQTLHLGVGLRWDPWPWLSPHARLWGGASLFQLEVTGTSDAFDTGYATSVFGALGAGFVLHTPPRAFESSSGHMSAFQVGLLFEVGYALRSAIDFRLRTSPDPRRIEVIDASLGSLDLSGGYFRCAGLVRF
jgi:hypothetical protein